jgi:biotin transport system substrate-specific component
MTQPNTPVLATSDAQEAVFTWKRVIRIALGALVVAISAQAAIDLPGSPVPITLQGLAVILVGGVLGAKEGSVALVLYLAAGMSGLPVFSGGRAGAAWLLGPTGGYLLAFPVGAAVAGAIARRHDLVRCFLASLGGMVVIHLGGIAQLSILTGGLTLPFRATVPLIAADLVKVVIAALLVSRLRGGTSSRA